MGGLIFVMILFFLPETSAIILRKRKQFKEKGRDYEKSEEKENLLQSMARPFKFFAKPVVILSTTPYSIAYGFMYFVIASLPHQLASHYNFSSYQIGLAYLSNGIGNALGALLSGKLSDRALSRVDEKLRVPEFRLSPMWIGIFVLPIGELMYGWCVERNIHFMASLTGLFLCK